MKRLLTFLTPSGVERREDFYSLLESSGASLIAKIYYESIPSEPINKFLELISKHQETSLGQIEHIRSANTGKPVEVGIWQSVNLDIGSLVTNVPMFEPPSDLNEDSKGLVTTSDEETDEFGGLFFWRTFSKESKFETINEKLFESVYLPVQLAKDGRGVFFDERLVNRLIAIRFLEKDDEVTRIVDNGGWQDINNLTASLDVEFRREGRSLAQTLLATALTPAPPVKPEVLSEAIRQRKQLLNLLEVTTSVLESEAGVVYEMSIPYLVAEYISSASNPNVRTVISNAARIAAILDSRHFNFSDIRMEGLDKISDYFDFGKNSSRPTTLDLNFVDALKTDGESVFWTKLDRNLTNYLGRSKQDNLEALVQVCDQSLKDYLIQEYRKLSLELDAEWFSSKLLGHE
jgi:hypothetical protein